MSRRFGIFYNIFSIVRLVAGLVMLTIMFVEAVNTPSPGDDELKWDLFPAWLDVVLISFAIAYPLNSIFNALVAFKPRWTLPGIFDWKPLFVLTYIAELCALPWILSNAWEQAQDAFFPSPPDTYLESVLGFLKTERDRSGEQWSAVWLCLFVISSLLFIIFFWKVFKARKRAYGQQLNNQ